MTVTMGGTGARAKYSKLVMIICLHLENFMVKITDESVCQVNVVIFMNTWIIIGQDDIV
jgi:hypothetical protein